MDSEDHVAATRARAAATSPAQRAQLRAELRPLLRRERRDAGLSQAELARAAGAHRVTLSLMEAGSWRPTTSVTRRIAVALRPDGSPVEVAARPAATARGRRRAAAWNRRKPYSETWRRAYAEAERHWPPWPSRRAESGSRLAGCWPRSASLGYHRRGRTS
ncbi:MAG: helix-turn-helix transcriptional regulator [Pseudonocardia sp.]